MIAARLTPLLVLLMAACAEPQRAPVEKPPQSRPAQAQAHAKARHAPPKSTRKPETKTQAKAEAKPAASGPLDLKALVQRLQDTRAIGLFTKAALKNQVDDLLGEFRALYDGKSQKTLAELRPPYDRLVLKVLALLQDKDPSLAKAIVASRERIWSVLADEETFSTI